MFFYFISCIIVPCFIYEIVLTAKYGKDRKKMPMHFLLIFLFVVYMMIMIYVTGIGTVFDIGQYGSIIRRREINLIPFKELIENRYFDFPNIIMFMPLGFLVPTIWKKKRKAWKVVLIGLMTSFLIEFCQLFNYRATDIDDIIYNTLGAACGYFIWKLTRRFLRKINKASVELSTKEALLVPTIAIMSFFFLFNPHAETEISVIAKNSVNAFDTSEEYLNIDGDEYMNEYEWVMEHEDYYPENKAQRAADNPELIHFMYRYANGDTKSSVDKSLTDEEVSDGMPYLFQWDERWGFSDYGENVVGFSGCGPTCMAMILSYFNGDKDITPGELSDYAMVQGYYLFGTGTKWSFMTDAPAAFGVVSRQITGDINELYDELKKGNPAIVSVGNGHFTETGHFIVLAGLSNGKVVVHDPNSVKNSEMLWDFEEFKDEIRAAWVYEK